MPGFLPAALPRRSRRHSPRTTGSTRSMPPAVGIPRSPWEPTHRFAGPDPSGSSRWILEGVRSPVHLRCTAPPCLPGPRDPTVLTRPGVVGAAFRPRPQLPAQTAPSFLRPLRRPVGEVSHPARSDSASWRTTSASINCAATNATASRRKSPCSSSKRSANELLRRHPLRVGHRGVSPSSIDWHRPTSLGARDDRRQTRPRNLRELPLHHFYRHDQSRPAAVAVAAPTSRSPTFAGRRLGGDNSLAHRPVGRIVT